MRQFREPFSLETAEGFPVDELRAASRAHARRASDVQEISDMKETEEKPRKLPNESERA